MFIADGTFRYRNSPRVFDPMSIEMETSFREMGWEEWAFLGQIDSGKAEALIETETPLEISYTHSNGASVKVVISVEQ